ncbi:hypothetical protein [Aquisphaera insulae]|uniref:hypothetical protein n=1 Tax=Aquisphaera insulae TaxID=2712864 RepID=UPI0013E9D9BB|nr:hypothetical protein [Aquisphaera insulae]
MIGGRRHPRLVGATLVVLATVLLAPSEARAGCSHALEARPTGWARLGFLEVAGALTGDDGGSPVRRGERHGGCTGPSCSGKSGLPVMPASAVTPRSAQWATLDTPPASPGPGAWFGSPAGVAAWADPSADAVFHPPRRTSSAS